MNDVLTLPEAAEMLRMSEDHLRTLIDRGAGPPCKQLSPKKTLFGRYAILRWLNGDDFPPHGGATGTRPAMVVPEAIAA